MPSLIETNPYLRDPRRVRAMIERSAYDSCVFEGARGLPLPYEWKTTAAKKKGAPRAKGAGAKSRQSKPRATRPKKKT